MPRGRPWAIYIDDLDQLWRLRVDADSIADPNRGWVEADPSATSPLPRGWLPRVVVGVDETGARRTARIGNIVCDLWTGAANQYLVEGTDGLLHTVQVFARFGERRS